MPRIRPLHNVTPIRPEVSRGTKPKQKPKKKLALSVRKIFGVLLAATGLGLGGLEVFYGWIFYSNQATNSIMWYGLGIGGAAFGLVNMIVPASLHALWNNRVLRYSGILIATVCCGMTIYADWGLSSANFGDSALARKRVVDRAETLQGLIASIESDKRLIPNPLSLEKQIQEARRIIPVSNLSSSKDCTEVTKSFPFCDPLMQLRRSKTESEDKLARLDAKWAEYSDELKGLPALTAPINPEIQSKQVWAFAVLVSLLPGFLLAFARALLT